MTRTKCQQPEEGEKRSRDALHTEPWVPDLIDQPLLNTWHFNSRTMDICISFLSVVMTFKILLYMWSIIAMCWSRGGFKAFTYNTTESGEWEQELGKVVIMA